MADEPKTNSNSVASGAPDPKAPTGGGTPGAPSAGRTSGKEPSAKGSQTSSSSTESKSAEAKAAEDKQKQQLDELRKKKGLAPKEEPKTEDAKPVEPKEDDKKPVDTSEAKGLSRLARLDEEHKANVAAFETKKKAFEAERNELAPLKAARDELASTAKIEDPKEREVARAKALHKLIGNDVTVTDIANLSAMIGNGPPPLTQADVEKQVQQAIEADRKAQKEAAEKKKRVEEEINNNVYSQQANECTKIFEASKDKYPAIAYRGEMKLEKFKEFHRKCGETLGRWPEPQEVVDFIEKVYREEARGLVPAITGAGDLTVDGDDKRGTTTEEEEETSEDKPKEDYRARKAKFRSSLRDRIAKMKNA